MDYRFEQLYGENFRNPIEVMYHEVFELENDDILNTLSNTIFKDTLIGEKLRKIIDVRNGEIEDKNIEKFFDEAFENEAIGQKFLKEIIEEIENRTKKKINYVLWLCNTVQDIIDEYELDEKLDEFDEYEDGFIILSDIGKDGKLYGYEQKPKYIKTVDRNGKII